MNKDTIVETWIFEDKDFNYYRYKGPLNNDFKVIFFKSENPSKYNSITTSKDIQFFRDIEDNPKSAILYVNHNINWIKEYALKVLKNHIKIIKQYE